MEIRVDIYLYFFLLFLTDVVTLEFCELEVEAFRHYFFLDKIPRIWCV